MAQQPWYMFPRIDAYGSPDPFGGFAKPDSNIQVPDGYAVTALLSGIVTGINSPDGSIPAWGAAITIKLDTPINSIATHTAYIHLASVAPGLSVGSKVQAGDIIGYSGGLKAAGSQKVPLGFALYAGDIYGYGAEWSKYLGNPALNMTPVLDAATGGKINTVASGASTTAGSASAIPGLSSIFTWISSLQPLWNWLGNPIRLVKLVAGIGLILLSIILLITPGDTIQQKAAFAGKLIAA